MVKMKDGEANDPCASSLGASDCSFVVLENPSLEADVSDSISFPSVLELPVTNTRHNGQPDGSMIESMASSVSPEEIHKRLREVYQENLELKEMLSQNNLAMKNQLATLLAWQTQVKDVFQQHGEKFTETRALIDKLRAENVMLKNLLEEQKNQSSVGAEGSKLTELLKVENAELKQTVEELRQSLVELRQRPRHESPSSKEVELMSLLRQVNERLELKERACRQKDVDLERLEAQLAQQMSAMNAVKQDKPSSDQVALGQQLSELRVQCERLSSDKEELAQELDGLRAERQRAAYVEAQSQGFQERLDRLTAQLVEREQELSKLLESTKILQQENEGIAILKAQVEVYQTDFNAEREGRERLAGEREQLVEQLGLLQRANQELTKKLANERTALGITPSPSLSPNSAGWNTIAAPSRHEGQVRQPSPSRHEPARAYDEEIPPPRRFVCPLCDQAFQLYDHLEHHVETCIN